PSNLLWSLIVLFGCIGFHPFSGGIANAQHFSVCDSTGTWDCTCDGTLQPCFGQGWSNPHGEQPAGNFQCCRIATVCNSFDNCQGCAAGAACNSTDACQSGTCVV